MIAQRGVHGADWRASPARETDLCIKKSINVLFCSNKYVHVPIPLMQGLSALVKKWRLVVFPAGFVWRDDRSLIVALFF
jgi:hypothetical protein